MYHLILMDILRKVHWAESFKLGKVSPAKEVFLYLSGSSNRESFQTLVGYRLFSLT